MSQSLFSCTVYKLKMGLFGKTQEKPPKDLVSEALLTLDDKNERLILNIPIVNTSRPINSSLVIFVGNMIEWRNAFFISFLNGVFLTFVWLCGLYVGCYRKHFGQIGFKRLLVKSQQVADVKLSNSLFHRSMNGLSKLEKKWGSLTGRSEVRQSTVYFSFDQLMSINVQ